MKNKIQTLYKEEWVSYVYLMYIVEQIKNESFLSQFYQDSYFQSQDMACLKNQQNQDLRQILNRIQTCLSKELSTPIWNSHNVASNLGMMRAQDEMRKTYDKLCKETDAFIKNTTTFTIENAKSFYQNTSTLLNQVETMFKSMSNELQKRVSAHQEAKKKNPYAVGPTKAVIEQSQKVLGSFFEYFQKVSKDLQTINERFIEKGKSNGSPSKSQKGSQNKSLFQSLENLKSQVQFLHKDLYGSFQTTAYLGLGRLWNEMMETHKQFTELTSEAAKTGLGNEKHADDFYQKSMKFTYDIHSSIKQMLDELERKKNTPICTKSVIQEAQNCSDNIISYLQKIRNQLKIIKNQYPNIKESIYQGFKKQPEVKRIEVNLSFRELDRFLGDPKLQDVLDLCIKDYLALDQSKQKLMEIKYGPKTVQVNLQVTGVPQREIDMFTSQLKRNLERLIEYNELNAESSRLCKRMSSSLSEKYLVFEGQRNSMLLVAKSQQMKSQMAEFNNEISQGLKMVIKDFIFKQKSQLSLSTKFLASKLKDPQYSEVQVRFDEAKEGKVTFFGKLVLVDQLVNALEQFVENLEGKIFDYYLSLTEEELNIIEKDQALKKYIESNWNLTLKFNQNTNIPAQINIQPHPSLGQNLPEKQIIFKTQFDFDSQSQLSCYYFKGKKQLQQIKRPCLVPLKKLIEQDERKNSPSSNSLLYTDKEKNSAYFYFKVDPLLILLETKTYKSFENYSISMYLPDQKSLKTNLIKLIQKLCVDQQFIKSQIKITFVCKHNQDLQTILGFKEGKNSCKPEILRKWFAFDNQNKLFYSQKGNQKIQNALHKQLKQVQLTNQDLNLEVDTHKLDFKRNIMTHTVTKKEFPITVHPDKITFVLYGVEKTIPDSEFKKVPLNQAIQKLTNFQISIGFYHIDLVNKIQTNLFSVYQRKIDFENVEIKPQLYDFTIQYDIKMTNLVIQYAEQNSKNIKTAAQYIKQNLNKKLIEISQPFDKDLTLESIRKFLPDAKEQGISIYLSNDKKSAVFKAYNDKNIRNFIKMLYNVGKVQIEFPKTWQPQTQEIQTFVVSKNTPEFQSVQKAFTAGNIVELLRIQNRLIFKKFYEEKLCLQELNGGKEVKQMLLYHGTSGLDPSRIYEDKQESFNINYTRDTNLLGKGIYFAERPEYSLNYSFSEDKQKGIKSMFYCRVLVGDSQKCPKHDGDIRDTDIKDQVNKIRYESMTDFLNGSNVFVVYKNRRAYPLYLIKYTRK